ncbi:MAG TPA: hypothetical protein P5295_17805 [Spirochaetota bacterium]|nr:hypothetical protein [Spirochaetota bacterium]
MARIELNPVFTAISGRMGDMVLYKSRTMNCSRTYVKPRNPDTPAQRSNRDLFRSAMMSWRSLSDFEKEAYNRKAARLPMTGHNLYISRYMRGHAGRQCPGTAPDVHAAGSTGSRADSRSFLRAFRSVAAPSCPADRMDLPDFRPQSPPG